MESEEVSVDVLEGDQARCRMRLGRCLCDLFTLFALFAQFGISCVFAVLAACNFRRESACLRVIDRSRHLLIETPENDALASQAL